MWLGALLASCLLHGLLVTAALWGKALLHSKPKRVVPIEAVTLTEAGLRPPPGNGGRPGAAPQSHPIVRQAPRPTVTTRPQAVPKEKIETSPKTRFPKAQINGPPHPALAMPRPAITANPGVNSPRSAGYKAESGNITGPSDTGMGLGGQGNGVGPGTARGTGQGSGPGTGGSLLGEYLREVRQLLEKHKDYPKQARLLHQEGVAVLQFTITRTGQVEAVQLSRSSGHDLLDRAATETLKRVGRFPPFPKELGRERLTVEIPMAFRLQ